jgi:N utilization substance protein B
MYIWMLSLITEVAGYAETDAQERANKYLPTAEDLNADVKILSNRFILSLQKNKEFVAALKKYKIAWDFEPELVKSLFTVLKNSNEYKEYLKKKDDTQHSDKDIIKFILKKVILKSSFAEQVFVDWEPDRIAMMDTLLMKMAIAEFINFTSVPVKVTINEYLEISKEFSTPKSNSFINGILDKILFELKEQNKIKKVGRGLIE